MSGCCRALPCPLLPVRGEVSGSALPEKVVLSCLPNYRWIKWKREKGARRRLLAAVAHAYLGRLLWLLRLSHQIDKRLELSFGEDYLQSLFGLF